MIYDLRLCQVLIVDYCLMRLIFPLVTFLQFLIISSSAEEALKCKNGGVPMLTRNKYVFSMKFQCLCPFNYYGPDCGSFRGLLCYFQHNSIEELTVPANTEMELQFQVSCYLRKMQEQKEVTDDEKEQPKKSGNKQYKLPLTKKEVEEDQNSFYPDYQIIWANDTTLFYPNGTFIKQDNQTKEQSEILASYPRYNFEYKEQFFGMPIFNTTIKYLLFINKFVGKSILLPQPNVTLEMRNQKIFGKLIVQMNKKQWQQFNVIKIQLLMKQIYGEDEVQLHSSMNSKKWRLADKNIVEGQIIQSYENKLPNSVLLLFVIFAGFAICFIAKKIYDAYKKSKNKNLIQQQTQDEQI